MANHIEQLEDEIDQIIPKKRREPPFKPGDSVTTNFFEKIPLQHETVTRCYRCRYCESGWMVDTADKKGKIYKGRDSHWFELEK